MTTLKVFDTILLYIISAFLFTMCNTNLKKNEFIIKDLPGWILEDHSKNKKSEIPLISLQTKINQGDLLEVSEIAELHPDKRIILSSSPFAMKEIFFQSGCSNGSQLIKIDNTKILDNFKDKWTGICSDNNKDIIEFNVYGFGNKIIYNFVKNFLITKTTEAKKHFISNENSKAIKIMEEIVEVEPAHPYSRLNLGNYYLRKKDCIKAIRHFQIFFRISPNFKDRERIFKSIEVSCKLFRNANN